MGVSGVSGVPGLSTSGSAPVAPVAPVLTDAEAFIAAAGITIASQKTAIERLISDLKAAGTWSKFRFIYPLVGGNAAAHSINLKDPRPLDAAYRITWSGGLTHDQNGVTGSTDGFGRTHYSGRCETMGFYTDSSASANDSAMGWFQRENMTIRSSISPRWANGESHWYAANSVDTRRVHTTTGPIGHFAYSYGQDQEYFGLREDAIVRRDAIAPVDALPIADGVTILAANNASPNGTEPGQYSARRYQLFYLGAYMTRTEMTANHVAFRRFQEALGRAIGDDPQMIDFTAAASITNTTQMEALNVLVKSLKAAGIWSKFKFIYPLVGGTAAAHAINLKDPRSTAAAYRVTWTNTVAHSAAGVQIGANDTGRGQTGYTGAAECMGLYTPSSARINDVGMGWLAADEVDRAWIHPRWTDGLTMFDPSGPADTRSQFRGVETEAIGHIGYSYRAGVDNFGFNRGAFVEPLAGVPVPPTATLTTGNEVALLNPTGGFVYHVSRRIYSYFYLSEYLTRAEMTANHNAIQAFQAALGRAA